MDLPVTLSTVEMDSTVASSAATMILSLSATQRVTLFVTAMLAVAASMAAVAPAKAFSTASVVSSTTPTMTAASLATFLVSDSCDTD